MCARVDFTECAGETGNIFFGGIETDMRNETKSSRIFQINKNGTNLLFTCVIAMLICAAQPSLAQLQITSPTEGTIVNPGQTLSVTVASSTNATFTNVGVVAEDPIGLSDLAASVPAQFSLAVPPISVAALTC